MSWSESLIKLATYEVETLQKRLAEVRARREAAQIKLALLEAGPMLTMSDFKTLDSPLDDWHRGAGDAATLYTTGQGAGLRGNSVVQYCGESYDRIVLVGGFSKAYSSLAAFVACPTDLKEVLKTAAPPYLYSGPSPTASLATVLTGFDATWKP